MSIETTTCTVGTYLIDRLHDLGVTHIFGVPGDFSLKFCELLEQDERISFVGTTREDTAGFAADGYARKHNGLGVVLVTHGVGALSTVNPIAGANAESSPVLIISGAPGMNERADNHLIHHSFGSEEAQKNIFKNFTCCAVSLDDPSLASRQIDQVLKNILSFKKPGYIELPRDLINKEIIPSESHENFKQDRSSDEETLKEAISETISLLEKAKNPTILAGVELHRFGVQNEFVLLAEFSNLPVAATIMGKSVINENHPLYLGVYQGKVASEQVQQWVETSDLLITLGVMFTDINLGMHTAKLDPNRMIQANQGEVIIKRHTFPNISLYDFITQLAQELKISYPYTPRLNLNADKNIVPFLPSNGDLTMSGIIKILNQKMPEKLSVVCDTGDCLFAAADLKVPDKSSFFASAFYTTMGFAVPAALGATCAAPETRPLILVGDGAFQMTGTELSTFKKLGLSPIVIVVNNGGYETERVILDGAFNDIEDWDYSGICGLLSYGSGLKTQTVKEFQSAINLAFEDKNQMYVIDAIVKESSLGMRRLATEIGRKIKANA